MEQCSETSAYKIQAPGNHPEESRQHSEHGESLKSIILHLYFFVLLTVHPCIIFFLMKPPRCTLLLSIVISTSLHVSGNYVPIIRRTYCIHATLVFFALYGWLSGLQSEKYQCRIHIVSSPGEWYIVVRNI